MIVAGHLHIPPQERDAWVAAHRDIVRQVRSESGCVNLAITADPLDERRVNPFELWRSEEHLAAWQAIAEPPPRPPILSTTVLRHRIGASGPPFDPPQE